MTDNINDRIDQSLRGPKDLNIDEKRHYLGNLRERIYLMVTTADLNDHLYMKQFFQHFPDFKNYQLFLNGDFGQNAIIKEVIAECAKTNTKFSLVQKSDNNPDIAILVVADSAINREKIDIKDLYHTETTKPEKHGFFDNLFRK